MFTRAARFVSGLLAIGACANVCVAQSTVSLPIATQAPGTVTYGIAMSSGSASAGYVGSVMLRVGPGDQVAVVDIDIDAVATWNGMVPFGIGSASASVIGFGMRHATPGVGMSVPATRDTQGNLVFSDANVPGLLIGTASHTSTPLVCTQISAAGAPCSGSFSLLAGGTRMLTVTGVVPPSASGFASVSITGFCPLSLANPSWGYVNAQAFWSGTLAGASCIADFNTSGGVTVQDIFDFLTAWFANDPRADISGGGVGAQDIFDYLSLWFTGC
jgi:hypothetical protein